LVKKIIMPRNYVSCTEIFDSILDNENELKEYSKLFRSVMNYETFIEKKLKDKTEHYIIPFSDEVRQYDYISSQDFYAKQHGRPDEFCENAIQLPSGDGIYFLFLHDQLVYIGQTTQGMSRIHQHFKDPEKEFDSFYFIPIDLRYVPDGKEFLDEVEMSYIVKYKPKYNKYIIEYIDIDKIKQLLKLYRDSMINENNREIENYKQDKINIEYPESEIYENEFLKNNSTIIKQILTKYLFDLKVEVNNRKIKIEDYFKLRNYIFHYCEEDIRRIMGTYESYYGRKDYKG
jgi:hypothetical protein